MPRVSLEVSYNRRWFGNFFVTDNLLTKASDYDQWTLTVPQNPNLPGGGSTAHVFRRQPGGRHAGRAELPDVRDRLRAGAHAVLARREDQPERAAAQRPHAPGGHEHRPRRAGHLRARNRRCPRFCSVARRQPAAGLLPRRPSRGRRSSAGSRRIPCRKSTFWSAPTSAPCRMPISEWDRTPRPTARRGTRTTSCPTRSWQQALGRLPNGGLANGTTSVNLLIPGQLYGPRITQVDMRFAKVLRFGATRADIGVDLYNLFNTSQRRSVSSRPTTTPPTARPTCSRTRSWRRGSCGST